MDTNTKIWILVVVGVVLAGNAGWNAITKPVVSPSEVERIIRASEVGSPAQYSIPSGTLGNVFFNELVAMRKAFNDGNDDEAARLVRKGQRGGTIVVFNKDTPATLATDLGDYLQLQPAGAKNKFWFGKNQVSIKNTKPTTSGPKRINEDKKVAETKWYVIPKGALGNTSFNDLVAIRKAHSDGNDDESRRLFQKGWRAGKIAVLPEVTNARLVTDLGEYVQLQPSGSTNKYWFGKNQVDAQSQ